MLPFRYNSGVRHMAGTDANTCELNDSDPEVFTAPWTLRVDWTRDKGYEFIKYACPEGNVELSNYINSSRAAHSAETSLVGAHNPEERGGAILTEE